MPQYRTPHIVFYLYLAIVPQLIYAQNDTIQLHQLTLEELKNVKIKTASNRSEALETAPATIYVITEQDIQDFGYTELQDALEGVPSIYLSNPHSWIWGGQRGFLSNFSQTLLMINGREVNNLVAYEGFISHQFATHNIKQIEIMAGPASALYGANALAGIINIITKDGNKDYEGAELHIETGSYHTLAGGFVFGTKLTDNLKVSGSTRIYQSAGEDFSDWVSNTNEFTPSWADIPLTQYYSHFGQYENNAQSIPINFQVNYKSMYAGINYYKNRQGHGQEDPSWDYTDREDIRHYILTFLGYKKKLSEKITLKSEYSHVQSKFFGRYYQGLWPATRLQTPSTAQAYIFDTWSPNSGARAGNNFEMLSYAQDNALIFDRTIGDTLSLQDYYPSFAYYLIDQGLIDTSEITNEDIHRYLQHIYTNKNSSGSTKDKATIQISWNIRPHHNLMFGYSYEQLFFVGLAITDAGQDLASTYEVPLNLSKRNSSYDGIKHGIYTQYQGELLPNRLWFNLGARFDHQNSYGGTFNPRCGLIYQFTNKSLIKLLYGEAFREGNVFELTANPELKPAKLRAFEFYYSQNIDRFVKNDITIYHNHVTDFISSVSSLIGENITSVSQQNTTGIEDMLHVSLGKYNAAVSGAYMIDASQKAQNSAEDEIHVGLPGIPKFKCSTGLTYKLDKNLTIAALNHFVSSYDAIGGSSGNSIRINSYNNLSLTLSATKIKIAPGQTLGVTVSVKNLLNSRYYHANIRQSGTEKFLQNGRHFFVKCTFKM
jgi:outer membrane cobalamin receptor